MGTESDLRRPRSPLSPVVCFLMMALLFLNLPMLHAAENPYLELRIYHVQTGKTDATIERFREHMADIYARHSIDSLGYWTSTNEAGKEFFLYLLKDSDKASFDTHFKAFLADPEFGAAYSAAMKKHGNTVEKIEAIPLTAFDWSPPYPIGKAENRTFELRLYEVAPGRMEEYANNYRDHRLALFKKHGLEAVGFWNSAGTNRPNTFVMMLAQENAAKIAASKSAYHADPKWNEAVKPLDSSGKPTLGVTSLILTPTSFSTIK